MTDNSNKLKMIPWINARTMAYNHLRTLSIPVPDDESRDEHDNRVLNAVEYMLCLAVKSSNIKSHRVLVYETGENHLVIRDDDGDIDAYSYAKSSIDRDGFMKFVEETAPDLLKLKSVSDIISPVYPDTPAELPEFKGMKLEELTKEKFEEFKKSYGMLIVEKEKLYKTIPIAAEIGLLFYKHGLKKPATALEFKKEYKKYFGGIPQWLVTRIYDVLPDEYKSLAGDNAKQSESKSDEAVDANSIDNIIEASIATGLICKKDGLADAEDLEAKLTRYEFDVPSTLYLKAITKAFKKTHTQFKNETERIY